MCVADFKIEGVISAMVTPFTKNGELDLGELKKLTAWQAGKVDALFPMGTSGEGLLMSQSERESALEAIVETVDGEIPVIAHVGAVTTRESINLARHAQDLGVAAISAINPFYFRVSAAEQIEHLCTIAEAAKKTPFFLYNNPVTAGNVVTEEVVKAVAERAENFTGIKDSSKSLDSLREYRKLLREDQTLLVGGDRIFASSLDTGVQGAVSTITNIYPEVFTEIYRAFKVGDAELMAQMQQHVCDILDILTLGPYFTVIKQMLEFRGIGISPTFSRSPIGRLSQNQNDEIRGRLQNLNILEGLV
jgi:dihydrodipicolinate synthase/N-acetylneuraminate lyase